MQSLLGLGSGLGFRLSDCLVSNVSQSFSFPLSPSLPLPLFFSRSLKACALTADLKQLPAGDATEIGEKGINLSGGQKQRVAIARAVYADADVYLLDDCLSAVDSQVAQHIFTRCLRHPKMLLRKSVLLVSHNLQLLPHADTVSIR